MPLLMAVDLGGRFRDPFPWWDASTDASDQHLREICRSCPLAAQGLLSAAKDISMAGPIGTAIMLAEVLARGAGNRSRSPCRPEGRHGSAG
jgi:selenophosphate synthetase-related protein